VGAKELLAKDVGQAELELPCGNAGAREPELLLEAGLLEETALAAWPSRRRSTDCEGNAWEKLFAQGRGVRST